MAPVYGFGFAGAKASSGNCSRDNKKQINIFYQNSSCPFDHSTSRKWLREAFWAQLTLWHSGWEYSRDQAASGTRDEEQAFEWLEFQFQETDF